MTVEYYWSSKESARQKREAFANPEARTWYRVKRHKDGAFTFTERQWHAPTVTDAPGYYKIMCMDTGQIVEYTERYKDYDAEPAFKDAVYVGQFYFHRTIILSHKDGIPGRYSIGFGGLVERELTASQALFVAAKCRAAGIPMPLIEGLEEEESNWIYQVPAPDRELA